MPPPLTPPPPVAAPVLWRGDGEQVGIAAPGPSGSPPPVGSAPFAGAHVRIHGLSGVGIAAAEAALRAGVHTLCLVDPAREDAGPGTLPALAGGTRAARTARLLRALNPDVCVGLDATRRVDGAIVTAYGAVAPPLHHRLVVEDTPHVAALVDEAGVTLLPVRPGVTACLRCRDLTRADRDPAWPLLARQCELVPAAPMPLDGALAGALAAGLLAALLRGDNPRAWRVEGGLPRRVAARPHRDCGCAAR